MGRLGCSSQVAASVVLGLTAAGCASLSSSTRAPRVFKDAETEQRALALHAELARHPEDLNRHLALGKLYLSEDLAEDAAREFESALHLNPRHPEAYLLLAAALRQRRVPHRQRIVALLEEAVRMAPEHADTHLHLAQAYVEDKESDRAIRQFERVTELSREPITLIAAHLGLMAIYEQRHEPDKARAAYERARAIDPGIDELLKQAELARLTPPPTYGGEELQGESPMHPQLEERMRRAREQILRMEHEAPTTSR